MLRWLSLTFRRQSAFLSKRCVGGIIILQFLGQLHLGFDAFCRSFWHTALRNPSIGQLWTTAFRNQGILQCECCVEVSWHSDVFGQLRLEIYGHSTITLLDFPQLGLLRLSFCSFLQFFEHTSLKLLNSRPFWTLAFWDPGILQFFWYTALGILTLCSFEQLHLGLDDFCGDILHGGILAFGSFGQLCLGIKAFCRVNTAWAALHSAVDVEQSRTAVLEDWRILQFHFAHCVEED